MSRGSKVQKYAYKAKVAQRKAKTIAIAAQQDAKFFNILKSAGSPNRSNARSSKSWGLGSYSGWVAEEYVSGYSSDFRAGEIKSTRYYYQYDKGNPDNWASMKPGTKKARIQYKGEDDWQRQINAAYWGTAQKEATAKQLMDAVPIAHPSSSSHWDYVSGSSYGGSDGKGGYVTRGGSQKGRDGEETGNINEGKVKAGDLAKSAAKGAMTFDPTKTYSFMPGSAAIALKYAVNPKSANKMESPLYNVLSAETLGKMTKPKTSKPKPTATQIPGDGSWGMGGGMSERQKQLSQQEKRAREENPILTKSTANPDHIPKYGKQTWTDIVRDSMYKSGYTGERLDDSIIQDMDKILGKPTDTSDWQSYWNQASERKGKSSADVTTGMIYDYYTQQIKSKEAEKTRLDQQIGQVLDEQGELERGGTLAPDGSVIGGETPGELRKKGKVNKRQYDRDTTSLEAITKSKSERERYASNVDWLATTRSEMSKVEKQITELSRTRGTLQTSEERLAEAKAINEQATARRQAKSLIKHYDPVGVNYLNPESVEAYHRRFKDAEILTQQNVRATYTSYLSPTTTVIRGPIKDKDSQIEGVRTGRVDTKERGIYLQAAGEWYQLTAQERKEFEEVARLHQGIGRVAGMDPDKPRTHMRWRKAAKSTEELIPKMKGYIEARDERLKELYVEKEKSNEEYSRHTTKITRLASEARDTYRSKGGNVSSDDIYDVEFIKELAEYAKEREGVRYAIAVLESERDVMKKDLKTTEDANEELKRQLKEIDRDNLAHGGGGGFLRPRSGPPGSVKYHAAVGQARIRRAGMSMSGPPRRQATKGSVKGGKGGFRRRRTRSGLGGLVV